MAKPNIELGSAELEVLRTLWDGGPATVRQVMERLHESGKKVAYTTVLTFLTRLEQKGCVGSDKSDVAYIYRSKVSREMVAGSRIKAMVRDLYGGEALPLALQLMQNEKFTPEEIDQLQKLIDRLDVRFDSEHGR